MLVLNLKQEECQLTNWITLSIHREAICQILGMLMEQLIKPFSVAEVISKQAEAPTAYATGYIVAGIKNDTKITTISSAADVLFGEGQDKMSKILLF